MENPNPTIRTNLYGLDTAAIAAIPALTGEPAFRSRQIGAWIYDRGAEDFSLMTDLSRAVRERLDTTCVIRRDRPARSTPASDDSATKYLFRLGDGSTVEAVWIRDEGRDTLCISSQAGCAYGCTFCATAAMKAGRNLTTGEILSQIAALREEMAARGPIGAQNLVFMGMGEPLANYENLVGALRLLCGDPGFGMAARRITVSTVGLAPEIRRLAREPIDIRLALSLNATTDELRGDLMPVNRKFPIREVLDALREYQRLKGSPVTLEYVLLRGINDGRDDARRLSGFTRSLQCKVNLIAYNAHSYSPFTPTSDAEIEEFRSWMLPTSSTITVRWSKGRDIQAACGQLSTLDREERETARTDLS
jgi:23S rRNA (adenine2503-C2)-methyltransferase